MLLSQMGKKLSQYRSLLHSEAANTYAAPQTSSSAQLDPPQPKKLLSGGRGRGQEDHHHHRKFSNSLVSSISPYTKTEKKKAQHTEGENSGTDARDDTWPGGTTHVLADCKPLRWLNWSIGTLKPQHAKPVSWAFAPQLLTPSPMLLPPSHITEMNQGSNQT